MKPHILIIDDEQSICTFLTFALEDAFQVSSATSSQDAYEIIERGGVQLVLLDLVLEVESGLDVLRSIKQDYPEIAIIMMTAFSDITSSVEAMRSGAFHYICKPLNIDELVIYINQALEFQQLSQRIETLSHDLSEMEKRVYYGGMVGGSSQMCQIYKKIEKLKDVDISVMITGESGTGKDLPARAIHNNGSRKNKPFVTVNCASLPQGMLEEEFFGCKKGDYPGALKDKPGKIELANHGTLYLDEVGDIPLSLQGKLLHVLQEQGSIPVGGNRPSRSDVRIISSTNKNLRALMQQGLYREDLFYRLQVFEIRMPALRERKADIPDLCKAILEQIAAERSMPIPLLTPRAKKMLMEYDYPGNVRELIHALEYAMILCDGNVIGANDLPAVFRAGYKPYDMDVERAASMYFAGLALKDVERLMIKMAVKRNPHSRRAAAKELEISERSLFYKLKEYGMD